MELIRTAYMRRFSCTGAKCPDTCCKNWSINIDKETYDRYAALKDGEFDSDIAKYVVPLPEENASDAVYAVIGLNETRHCPFLSQERTCSMQNRYGIDYLSNACVMYPRIINYVNGRVEQCGDVSCPVMADLVLGNSSGIDFVEDDVDVQRGERNLFFSVVDFDEAEFSDEIVDFASDLRTRSFELLLDRENSLEVRLQLLGMLYSDVQKKLSTGDTALLRAVLDKDHKPPVTEEQKNGRSVDSQALHSQLKILQSLVKAFRGGEGNRYAEYERCYEKVMASVGGEDGSFDANGYTSSYEEYYEPFIGVLGYLLENYIVNEVFRCLLPLSGIVSGNVLDGYVRLLLRFALIRLHLVGIAGSDGGLTKKTIVDIVHLVVRSLETNRLFAERVDELLGENTLGNDFFSLILLTPVSYSL